MSELLKPVKVNLTISVMYRDEKLLLEAKKILEEKYGAIDMESPAYSFSAITPYYDPEMGEDIHKVIYSFAEPVERDVIVDVKLFCAELEKHYSKDDGSRLLNLDPGLISLENFILATGKNHSHRIYLRDGVYAEVTLMFGKKRMIKELPWSYKDYLYEPARTFLLEARENYRAKRKILLTDTEGDEI